MSDWPLYLLVLVLPFEPLEPVVRWAGFELSTVELAAAAAMALVVAGLCRSGGPRRSLRAIPFGVVAVAFVAVGVVSAALAPTPFLLPFKASLRTAAGVASFLLAATVLRPEKRGERLLVFFAISGTVVATVIGLEVLGIGGVLALLEPFRRQGFEVGGLTRAAGTFAYPNTAAGFLVLALPATVGLAIEPSGGARVRHSAAAASALLFVALLFTYSRGALLGALAGVGTIAAGLAATKASRPVRRRATALLVGFIGLAGLKAMADPYFRLRTVSEGDASWYRAEFAPGVSMLSLEPGELCRVPVRVSNRGRLRWQNYGGKRFHLSYHWYDLARQAVLPLEGERTPLPRPMEPGDGVTLEAFVRAPLRAGRYLLVWDMVQEETTWFVGKGGGGKVLPVVVGHRPPFTPAQDVPVVAAGVSLDQVSRKFLRDSWFPGRLELWSLAWKLFRENPLLGVGPDNFRWLYGPAAHRTRWDTRVFSNSLYLETLATTGLAGALCFFWLVGGVTVALLRQVRSQARVDSNRRWTALVLAAGLVGFLTHGLFDYLLEQTPIYLAFYLLLGAGAARLTGKGDAGRI